MKVQGFIKKHFTISVSILLTLLFIYAAGSKILDFENFQVQLAQSPLLSAYAGIVSYSIIGIEFIVAILLCFSNTRLIALYASLGLMAGFTIYIFLILNFSDFIPCSCGGILEKLGWTEHLIFNIFFLLLATIAIFVTEKQKGTGLRRPAQFSFLTTVISCALVIALFLSSEHIIKKENNFTRRFLLHPVIENKTLLLDNSDYYFAGSDSTHIYLGNHNFPQILLTVDTALVRIETMKIIPDNIHHNFRNLRVQVRAPYYYFYDGTVPVIYRGLIGDTLAHTISYGDAYFNQLVALDTNKFALRTQSSSTKEFTIAFLNLPDSIKVKLYPEILKKQFDGVFDVDGNIITDRHTNDLIYLYTYRNQFIVMDEHFNINRSLNTIDTTSIAQIKTTKLADGRHKMNAPPVKVNRRAVAYKGLLFNQSDLMGRHESRKSWEKAKVVDVYHTDRKEYIGSFYIYKKKDNGMKDFWVTDNYFYAISGDNLRRFKIRDGVF
ncbi:DoxX family protein [Chryseobacterium sp. c4a]|uniref:DoxX family protein n=1 Tax=Chryseobacterium sp. c4a TaxID=1573582 RepID=UPI001E38A622|nr:MauE/DoxX family redox-associated membrane protein [Chryseobacterium sp. c4a]